MDKLKIFFERWWIGLGLVVFIPILWLIAQSFVLYTDIPNSNFFKIWLAGNMILTGADPYSPADWLNGHLAFHSSWVPEKAFLYPLPLAYILSPLGLFPPAQAYTIWAFLSMLACVGAIFILVNQWEQPKLKLFAFLFIITIFFFAPMLETVGKGTIGALLLLAIAFACELLRREKSFFGGIVFSILLLKPQLGVPILAGIGLWMLFRRDWHGLSGVAAGTAILFIIGEVGDLLWVTKFLAVSQQKFGLAFGSQPTVFSMAGLVCANGPVCTLGLGSLLSLALGSCMARILFLKAGELSVVEAFSLAAPVGMLVTPYLWSYDHILLIIPLIWLVYQLILRTEKFTYAMLFLIAMDAVAGLGFFLQGVRPEKDFWNFTVPLLTLILVVCFVALPLRKPGNQLPQQMTGNPD